MTGDGAGRSPRRTRSFRAPPSRAASSRLAVLLGAASVGAAPALGAATESATAERAAPAGQDPFGGRSQPAAPASADPEAHREVAERRDAFDEATVGGVYGRFDGDLSLSLGAGAELGFDPASPRLLGTVALRYYSLIGVYAGYREGLRGEDPLARGLSAGILLEPLFLLRWSRASTTGSAFWDLTLDSLGLAFGAHADQPAGGNFASARGFELGLGGGVPLLAWAEGPWIRTQGQLRWFDDGAARPVVWLTLEWRTFFESGLQNAMGLRR